MESVEVRQAELICNLPLPIPAKDDREWLTCLYSMCEPKVLVTPDESWERIDNDHIIGPPVGDNPTDYGLYYLPEEK